MDQLVEPQAREALVAKMRDEAQKLREKPEVEDDSPPVTDDSVRSSARTDTPIPEPPFWGVREVEVDLDDVFPYLDRHVLFKLHWGGRGKKGEEWRKLLEGDGEDEGFVPKLERMWREQDYIEPRAKVGYFPCNADGNELVIFDPESPDTEIERLVFPRQPKHDRICLTDFFRPLDSGERDVVALQGVTAGPKSTELLAKLEAEGEFSEQLFVTAWPCRRPRAWPNGLHAEVRRGFEIDLDQGRRYSWGYPACPEQSEHEKVWRLLDLEEIGMTLSGGYAVMPEQSTVAVVAHHPQAVYFGMKSGFIPKEKAPDELIAGTDRGGRAAAGGRAARRLGRGRGRRLIARRSIASRNDSIPNEPSSRAATFPDRSIVKSHGSVGSPNAWSGSRRPFSRIVVVVDLLVDELHLVAVLLLELRGDVHDRPADARLTELWSGHQQRDRLLAQDLVEADVVHVVDRLAGAGHLLDAAKRGERVGLHVRSLFPDGDNRILLPHRDAGGGPELLPSDVRDGEDRGLAGFLERDLGPVDGGDRVRLGGCVLTAELTLGHKRVGRREEGPLCLVLRGGRHVDRRLPVDQLVLVVDQPERQAVLPDLEHRAGESDLAAGLDRIRKCLQRPARGRGEVLLLRRGGLVERALEVRRDVGRAAGLVRPVPPSSSAPASGDGQAQDAHDSPVVSLAGSLGEAALAPVRRCRDRPDLRAGGPVGSTCDAPRSAIRLPS